jgi:hypothetical protein
MVVLRMGFPGLESAVRYTFSIMKTKEINVRTISFVSHSVLIPRASMHLHYFTNLLFGNHIPFKGRKVITSEDLMEFELAEVKPHIIVQVYPGEENFSTYTYFSKDFIIKPDAIIGAFREPPWSWDATCKDYESIVKASPIDLTKMSHDKAWQTEYKMFRLFTSMISCATLLYYLYNLDNGVELVEPDSSDSNNVKKIRAVAEMVKELGNTFPEAVAVLIFGSRFALL